MMLMCSGGRSSPRLSRSLFPPHSSPVVGLNARPTVFLSPRAKMRPPEPSALNCDTAARSESLSSQRLQDDPTARYSLPSGPNRMVRVECPPYGTVGTLVTGAARAGTERFPQRRPATHIVAP